MNVPTSVSKPSSSIPETISDRIRAIRYVGIMGVVFARAVQLRFFFGGLDLPDCSFLDRAPVVFVHTFVLHGLFRGAVPLFFLFAAYLQFARPRGYGETIRRRARTLLVPMAVWSVLSLAALFSIRGFVGIPLYSMLTVHADGRTWLMAFLGNFAHPWIQGTHCPSFMYPFWFLRDLFILTVFSPAIDFLVRERRRSAVVLLVFGALFASGYCPAIVGSDALFFFALGAFFGSHRIDFMRLVDRYWHWGCVLVCGVCAVAWMFYRYDGNPDPFPPAWVTSASTLLLLKLSGVIATSKRLFPVAAFLDGQSFFLFCAHAPIGIALCQYAAYHTFFNPASQTTVVAMMVFVAVVDTALCTGVGVLLRRYFPRVFAFLTGGRAAVAKR